jgi:FkbM family methyltransferase
MSHTTTDIPSQRFYAQHGEDIVAYKALQRSQGPRYFVEVGMIDGKRFSNTLAFEHRGWRGLCVEAHPAYVEMVRTNRPNSTVVHAAAADVSGQTMPFYADPRGDLSSLVARDESEMKKRFGHWFKGYDVVHVPVRTLNDMLREANAPTDFELLSIDIEGGELAALRGLDLDHWKPRVLILEADDNQALSELNDYLAPHHYTCARRVGINAIFTRYAADAWRIRLAKLDDRVLHTAHPTDHTIPDQIIIPSTFETKSQYLKRLIRTVASAA